MRKETRDSLIDFICSGADLIWFLVSGVFHIISNIF